MAETADFWGLLTQGGELASLILVSVTLVIAIILAMRARSTRSFQFEMFVWVLVLFFSEIPRIVETIGLADISSIGDAGLLVHTASMVLLTGFVGVRTYKFFKR